MLEWYVKQVFSDPTTNKLTIEAKKAIKRLSINSDDLIERSLEYFNYHAMDEHVTPEIVKKRFFSHENRRRKLIR